jgi:hypothetical protein
MAQNIFLIHKLGIKTEQEGLIAKILDTDNSWYFQYKSTECTISALDINESIPKIFCSHCGKLIEYYVTVKDIIYIPTESVAKICESKNNPFFLTFKSHFFRPINFYWIFLLYQLNLFLFFFFVIFMRDLVFNPIYYIVLNCLITIVVVYVYFNEQSSFKKMIGKYPWFGPIRSRYLGKYHINDCIEKIPGAKVKRVILTIEGVTDKDHFVTSSLNQIGYVSNGPTWYNYSGVTICDFSIFSSYGFGAWKETAERILDITIE